MIDLDADLKEGDLVWLETPLNPTGEVRYESFYSFPFITFTSPLLRDISYYAKKAHAAGAKLGIDATFAPPPLQNPFDWDVDIIMHSGECCSQL